MLKCLADGAWAFSFNPVIANTSLGSVLIVRSPIRMACNFSEVVFRSCKIIASSA